MREIGGQALRQPLAVRKHALGLTAVALLGASAAHAAPFFAPALYNPGGLRPVCVVTNTTSGGFAREFDYRHDRYKPPKVSIQIYDANGQPQTAETTCPLGAAVTPTPTPVEINGLLSHASCTASMTVEEGHDFPSGVFFCRVHNPGRAKVRVVFMLVDADGRVATLTASRRDEGTP